MFKLVCYWVVCAVLSCSVMSNSWYPMDCSWAGSSVHGNSPSMNTGVGCHALLQEISLIRELNQGLLHCRQILYQLSCQGSYWVVSLFIESAYLTTTTFITWNIFFHFVDCLFTSVIVSFDIHKFFILKKSSLPFLFLLMLFCHIYNLLDKSKVLCVSILLKIAEVFFLLFFVIVVVCLFFYKTGWVIHKFGNPSYVFLYLWQYWHSASGRKQLWYRSLKLKPSKN